MGAAGARPGGPGPAGAKRRTAAGGRALCVGPDREEAEAVSHLLKKGCLARRFADAVPGCRPLNRMDALFQRAFYVTQYAKRKG